MSVRPPACRFEYRVCTYFRSFAAWRCVAGRAPWAVGVEVRCAECGWVMDRGACRVTCGNLACCCAASGPRAGSPGLCRQPR
jgi:hypothetical protein